jgi:hypothetical protein
MTYPLFRTPSTLTQISLRMVGFLGPPQTSDLAEVGAEGIGIGLTVSDLGIGSEALALGIEGLTLGGLVAEVFLAPGAGVEATRGVEVGWNREAKGLEAKGVKIRDWKKRDWKSLLRSVRKSSVFNRPPRLGGGG